MRTLELVDAHSGVEFGFDVPLATRRAGASDRLVLVLPGVERVVENEAFVERLAERFTVVMPSHPGFGLSPRPAWCTDVTDLADLYLEWLQRSGHDDVTVVGLQFGGWVALEMAVRRPRNLTRLVLVDSFGIKLGGVTDREFVDVFATDRDRLEHLTFADPSHALGDLGQADLGTVLEVTRNEEALAVYGWQPYLHNPSLIHALDRIDVPTDVVWGERDGIVSADHGRGLSERLRDARFHVIPDAGHRPQVERPDEVARLIAG